jgi:hypothetical protein
MIGETLGAKPRCGGGNGDGFGERVPLLYGSKSGRNTGDPNVGVQNSYFTKSSDMAATFSVWKPSRVGDC